MIPAREIEWKEVTHVPLQLSIAILGPLAPSRLLPFRVNRVVSECPPQVRFLGDFGPAEPEYPKVSLAAPAGLAYLAHHQGVATLTPSEALEHISTLVEARSFFLK